ncbi:putative F-box/FBD/LRR-repeat protein [Acorus calamus]|uniref:F-box/FBD/LRR-repeat protein n=1 Tax=Acorus calamus TaxID=4465 RepID=A0AAV9EBK4_ACOCL|nr:putative F-box/FBD/LRR-repeat protein [Acorus calamus]
MEVDRLSELPENVIHQILSSLKIKEQGTLSKRWRDLFSSIPTLDYCHKSIHGNHYNPNDHEKNRLRRCQHYIDIVDGLLRLSNPTTHVE